MIVAVAMVHSPGRVFMNWTGRQKGEGFEYHLLAMALLLVLLIRGSGAYSIDQILARSFDTGKTEAMVSS